MASIKAMIQLMYYFKLKIKCFLETCHINITIFCLFKSIHVLVYFVIRNQYNIKLYTCLSVCYFLNDLNTGTLVTGKHKKRELY